MAKYAPLSPPIQGMPIAGLDQREVKTLPGYQDDWDLLQENLESSGMFPFAPGLGDAASELGDLILYSASGKGRDGIDRVNDLDRFVTLPATWAGQAAQEFGGLMQMKPEQLVQLRRSLGALFSGDPEAKAALWEGIKQAASGYDEDPMSLAEDVGSPGLAIAAPRLSQKILSGLAKKTPKMDFPEGPGLEKLSPKTPSDPLAPEVSAQQLASYHMPQAAGWDVDNIDADQWDNFVHSDDADAIKLDVDDVSKIKVPDEVKKALDAEDALGFSTSNEAAKEILMHPDWDGRWEIVSEDNKKIIKDWVDSLKAKGKPDAGKDPAMVQKGGLLDEEGFLDLEKLQNKYKELLEGDDIDMMSNDKLGSEIDNIKQIINDWPSSKNIWTGEEGLASEVKADFWSFHNDLDKELGKRIAKGEFKDPSGKYAKYLPSTGYPKSGSDVVDDFPLQGTNVDDALKGIPINEFDNKTLDAQIDKLKNISGEQAKKDLRRLTDERARRGGSDTPETPKFDESIVVGKPNEEDLKLIKTAWHNMSAKSDADIQKNIEKLHDGLTYKSDTEDWDIKSSLLNVYMSERAKRVAAGTWVYT